MLAMEWFNEMGLIDSASDAARQKNIATEITAKTAGKTGAAKQAAIKRAVAIGYAVQRKAAKKR